MRMLLLPAFHIAGPHGGSDCLFYVLVNAETIREIVQRMEAVVPAFDILPYVSSIETEFANVSILPDDAIVPYDHPAYDFLMQVAGSHTSDEPIWVPDGVSPESLEVHDLPWLGDHVLRISFYKHGVGTMYATNRDGDIFLVSLRALKLAAEKLGEDMP